MFICKQANIFSPILDTEIRTIIDNVTHAEKCYSIIEIGFYIKIVILAKLYIGIVL